MSKMFFPIDKVKFTIILIIALTLVYYLFYKHLDKFYKNSNKPLEHFESESEKNMSKILSQFVTRDLYRSECKHIKRIGGNKNFLHLAKDSLYR